jgi:hypothetical protein
VTRSKIELPYENLSLISLPKERWKEIPGFEGYYKISNYGRVRTVPHETVNNVHGGVYTRKERLLKAHVIKKVNKTLKEETYGLNITLSKDGIRYNFQIARLVYYLFKEKFDLSNKLIFITTRDNDGRNVHISNLVKMNMTAIKLASYKDGRAISHLKKLSKPVTQFDQDGIPLRSYPSMYEAGKALGTRGPSVAEVINGPGNMYKGYFWKAGIHTRKLNLKKLLLSGKELPEIHTTLQKRLRIKKIDKNNIPAIINLSIKSIKGEVWKDFPGYKGLYMISNCGRVKALQKITQGEKKMWMPERIKMLSVDFRRRENDEKEIPGSTIVTLAKNGQKKTLSVSRFVYFLFVKKFKLSDSAMKVFYKDGNSLNINYKNLVLKRGVWSFEKLSTGL